MGGERSVGRLERGLHVGEHVAGRSGVGVDGCTAAA